MRNGAPTSDSAADRERGLVARACLGDSDAFAALYESYVDRVYRYLCSRVLRNDLAEELTAQAFLKSWEAIRGYRPGAAPFAAWLFRIARNVLIDHLRREKESVPLELLEPILEDASANVEALAARALEVDRLRGALGKLTEDQLQVLTLKFLADLPTQEVAQVLGKRAGTVRALQMRGLKTLARLLEAEAGSRDE